MKLLREADYFGIVLMAIGLGTLEYFLEEGTRWNWFSDSTITACAWISGISITGFILRSLMVKNPVVDFRALGDRNFALGCFLSFVTGIGIFSTIYLTPLFLGYVRGFSAWQTGTPVFSTGIASILGVPVYILLARHFDLRWLMMAGLACSASPCGASLSSPANGAARNCSSRNSSVAFRRCSASPPPSRWASAACRPPA